MAIALIAIVQVQARIPLRPSSPEKARKTSFRDSLHKIELYKYPRICFRKRQGLFRWLTALVPYENFSPGTCKAWCASTVHCAHTPGRPVWHADHMDPDLTQPIWKDKARWNDEYDKKCSHKQTHSGSWVGLYLSVKRKPPKRVHQLFCSISCIPWPFPRH